MSDLERMTVGQRFLLALFIIFVIMFALAMFGYLGGRWDDAYAQRAELYEGIPFDAHLLALDKRALDEAYHAQLLKLFGVWLSSQAGDTRAISNGLHIARRAYSQAAAQIAKREQEQQQRK